jgi:hypothetical protein
MNSNLTPGSLALFTRICKATGNWGGTPPTYDFITGPNDPNKGHLTDLKKNGLVRTDRDEGIDWIFITDKGTAEASALGLEIHA